MALTVRTRNLLRCRLASASRATGSSPRQRSTLSRVMRFLGLLLANASVSRPMKVRWLRAWAFVAITSCMSLGETPSSFHVIGYFTEDAARSGTYTVKNLVTRDAAIMLTDLEYACGRVR